MISESVICDYCGLAEISVGAIDWFKLEKFGIDVTRFSEDMSSWRDKHFCGWECLYSFAERHRETNV